MTAPPAFGHHGPQAKLDSRAWTRLSLVLGALGAVAFLQNVGVLSGANLRHGGDAAVDATRSLTLEDHERTVTVINERVLAVAVNGITEGFYELMNPGTCLDKSNTGYDYVRFFEDTVTKCANRCATCLLLSEHRGFNYDDATNDCCCLYDDHRLPLTEKRRADNFNVELNGYGPVDHVNSADASYKCYKKEPQALGPPIDEYVSTTCADDNAERDVIGFGSIWNETDCADRCFRFKLFATHVGFTQEADKCSCLFQAGEAPSPRKLGGSGAFRSGKLSYQERYELHSDPNEVVCYDKKAPTSASPADRIQPDTTQRVWINEFHYRNEGINQPFVEVIGPKDTSAVKYEIVAYQGRNGAVHRVFPLTGTFEGGVDDKWGYVTVDLTSPDLRKGKMGGDGIALVNKDGAGTCVQLLSYTDVEGFDRSFMAKEGVCNGFASTPVGVTEGRLTPLGYSLQLEGGPGNTPSAFTWSGPRLATKGGVNADQVLIAP